MIYQIVAIEAAISQVYEYIPRDKVPWLVGELLKLNTVIDIVIVPQPERSHQELVE